MKYDWLIEKQGSHYHVKLRLTHEGLQWGLDRFFHKEEWDNTLARTNLLTMMIDDMFRNLGRHTIQLPEVI